MMMGMGMPMAVYPRVCGGTWYESAERSRFIGLSPRVRGNPDGAQSRAASSGSIPACAGEPEHGEAAELLEAVYPRVCGGTVPGGPP